MTTLREAAEAVMEQLKGTWVSESDPVAQDLKAALAEPVQEPVAWLDEEINCAYTPEELDGGTADGLVPLFTAPPASVSEAPQRKPLNEDQMYEACINVWRNLPDGFGHTSSEWIEAGIRYAERVHGIGEQK